MKPIENVTNKLIDVVYDEHFTSIEDIVKKISGFLNSSCKVIYDSYKSKECLDCNNSRRTVICLCEYSSDIDLLVFMGIDANNMVETVYVHHSNQKALTLDDVKEIYMDSPVCMSETLATIPANGLSLEEAFDLYAKAIEWSDNDKIVISQNPETVEISLSPETSPLAYAEKVNELMEECGLSKEEAEREALRPIPVELVYERNCGLFAIEKEVVDCSDVWSPYTQKPITF